MVLAGAPSIGVGSGCLSAATETAGEASAGTKEVSVVLLTGAATDGAASDPWTPR